MSTDWLAELDRVTVVHPNTFTLRELMAEADPPIGEKLARNYVRLGIKQGILRPARKSVIDLGGRPQTVVAYERIKREVLPCPSAKPSTSGQTSNRKSTTGGSRLRG